MARLLRSHALEEVPMDEQERDLESITTQTHGAAEERPPVADEDDPITGYSEGTASDADDPAPLIRDDEGMDR